MNLPAATTTCLLALLLFAAPGLSQDSPAPGLTRVTRVTFLAPGLSHERPLARRQSLYLYPHFSVSAGWGSTFGFRADADPALAVHYRHYYNLDRRAAKGKSTGRNSGNYLAALYDVTYTTARVLSDQITEEHRRPVHVLAAVWGLQRNGRKRFCLDLNLGGGYFFAKGTDWYDPQQRWVSVNSSGPFLYTNISLGFWLGKRIPGTTPNP